eukprot:scaffold22312_cov48-Attheya_sp.AAC.2
MTGEDELSVLPYFASLKEKVQHALYGKDGVDKSPKGSVDEPIQPLVDLLNRHPHFATLSSCSGRIALFDPNHKDDISPQDQFSAINSVPEQPEGETDDPGSLMMDSRQQASGKGSGRWLLSCHHQIETRDLVDSLDSCRNQNNEDDSFLILKHETVLLHVAASNLHWGRQLLSLALQLGFRESGLVVSKHKITVAIRTTGLTLSVPLASHGAMRPPLPFLDGLVADCNRRFLANQAKLDSLYQTVKDTFFSSTSKVSANNDDMERRYKASFQKFPELNLWSHAAVIIPNDLTYSSSVNLNDEGETDLIVLVFGGHGTGPDILVEKDNAKLHTKQANKKSSRRSDQIYSIRRRGNIWDTHWMRQPHVSADSSDDEEMLLNMPVRMTSFPALQGHDACVIANNTAPTGIVVIFGGRAGPAKPSNDLLLYDPDRSLCFCPRDIRGMPPSPRWGHSITTLLQHSGNKHVSSSSKTHTHNSDVVSPWAVVMGGRNGTHALSSIHVLSLVNASDTSLGSHLLWQELETPMDRPLYHHAAALVKDRIFVFGGQSKPSNLLESFQPNSSSSSAIAGYVEISGDESDKHLTKYAWKTHGDRMNPGQLPTGLMCGTFGASACSFHDSSQKEKRMVLISGGVPCQEDSIVHPAAFQLIEVGDNPTNFDPRLVECDDDVDLGSMVHHRMLSVVASQDDGHEFLILGGGVDSFAFGPVFARNYRVSIRAGVQAENTNGSSTPDMKRNADKQLGTEMMSTLTVRDTLSTSGNNGSLSQLERLTPVTQVLYVTTRNAKKLKNELERHDYLDTRYRMIKADERAPISDYTNHIAVPVTKDCFALVQHHHTLDEEEQNIQPHWTLLVTGLGTQECPYSTKVLGQISSS